MDELTPSQLKRQQRKRQRALLRRQLRTTTGERDRARADRARFEGVLVALGYQIEGPSGRRQAVNVNEGRMR